MALSLARVLLVMVPFALLLRHTWGPDAVYASELVANLAGGALSMALAWYYLSHRQRQSSN